MNKSNMELGVIASVIVTLGDTLGTIAAVLALEDEVQLEKSNQLIRMQKQIDYLTNELSKVQ